MEHKTTAKDQEIDLSYLYKSIKNFFENIIYGIFNFFSFFMKNKIPTILLLIIGGGLSILMYKNDKKAYKSIVVISTNFGSTEYVYNKINNFNKAEQNAFPGLVHISSIEIEPVIDIYSFLSDGKENIEMAKYMSENTIEVSKFKEKNNVEKLYRYHKIKYTTDIYDEGSKIYTDLIDFLNKDTYLKQAQEIGIQNTKTKLAELEKSVESINAIFDNLGVNRTDGKGDIKIDMYSQINELMLTKNSLMKQINKTRIQLLEEEKIIYDVNSNQNLYNKSIIKPILMIVGLLFMFFLMSQIIKKYRKFKQRENQVI